MSDPFAEILDGARRGDEAAWTSLYAHVAPRLLGYLRARGAGDPEGLLGDTFLQIARNLATFRGDEVGFRSWAFTVAHHRLVDERRRLRRKPTPAPLPEDDAHIEADPTDVESEVIAATDPDVEALLEGLSDDARAVVMLRILGGLSTAETAATIGKSEGAVRVIQHRALRAMKDRIESRGVTT